MDSAILFRARTNTLNLQWRKKITDEDTTCPLCKLEEETLDFIIVCEKLNDTRNECLLLMRPKPEDSDQVMRNFLLFQKDNDEKNTECGKKGGELLTKN